MGLISSLGGGGGSSAMIGAAQNAFDLQKKMRNTMMVATALFFPVWWLTSGWGNHGLWLAMNLFMASRGVLMGWVWYRISAWEE